MMQDRNPRGIFAQQSRTWGELSKGGTLCPPRAFLTHRQHTDGSTQPPGSMQSWQHRDTRTGPPLPTGQGLGENTSERCHILVQFGKKKVKWEGVFGFLGDPSLLTPSSPNFPLTSHNPYWITAQALVTTATTSNSQLEPWLLWKLQEGLNSCSLEIWPPAAPRDDNGPCPGLHGNSRARERNEGKEKGGEGEAAVGKKRKCLTWQLALNLDKPSRALHLHWDTPSPQSC